jgi:hypothetical protein
MLLEMAFGCNVVEDDFWLPFKSVLSFFPVSNAHQVLPICSLILNFRLTGTKFLDILL